MNRKLFNLVLGTAQLDKNYSFSKKGLSEASVKKIFNLAKKNKNFFIDTALGYKNSEKILSKFDLSKFKIITKFEGIKKNSIKELLRSKEKLKIKKFYGILFHDEKKLMKKSPEEFSNLVKSLKENNITDRVGVSVYTLKYLKLILKKFNIDLLQLPANVFDKRFLDKKLLKILKKKKIKIFIRSVFLKGVLINQKYRTKKLLNFKQYFQSYENWLKKKKITNKKFFCINFILENKLNNIVIGFDDYSEYKEILNFRKENYVNPPIFVKNQSDKNKLLRPDFW
jgi:aryl-alcohol dehydrogenase-like predicted oxidoreductase